MKQLPLPAHPVFPSRLDSLAALPELLRSRQIGCVLVIGDAHAVDCESLLLPVLEDRQIPPNHVRSPRRRVTVGQQGRRADPHGR